MISYAALALFFVTVAVDCIPQTPNQQDLKWQILRTVNYIQWVFVSSYALAVDDMSVLYTNMIFSVQNITVNYVYELVFHSIDMAHVVHHGVSIILHVMWVYAYITNNNFIKVITVVGHANNVAMISSIFSSLRQIVKVVNKRYYIKTVMVYKFMYVASKTASAVYQYAHLINTKNPYRDLTYTTCMGFLCCLHTIQGYFVCKILATI